MQRTWLQLRIGCHAAFNACEEMCDRVALERQLNEEERALLLARSKAVIRQGREILYANNNMPTPEPDLAAAVEQYAAGIATASSHPPTASIDALSTLSEPAQRAMQQIARLPDWTGSAIAVAGEQAQGATPQ